MVQTPLRKRTPASAQLHIFRLQNSMLTQNSSNEQVVAVLAILSYACYKYFQVGRRNYIPYLISATVTNLVEWRHKNSLLYFPRNLLDSQDEREPDEISEECIVVLVSIALFILYCLWRWTLQNA